MESVIIHVQYLTSKIKGTYNGILTDPPRPLPRPRRDSGRSNEPSAPYICNEIKMK